MSSHPSQQQILTDEPRWSSASLCVKLDHLGRNFRPEYTHQLVQDECWRGHRPNLTTLQTASVEYQASTGCKINLPSASKAIESAILHKSHEKHETTASQLEIRVLLSPSCEKCCVDIVRSANKKAEHLDKFEDEPDTKKRKIELDPQLHGSTTETDMSSSDLNPLNPMTDLEILDALGKALPPIIPYNEKRLGVEDHFLSKPVGDVLDEYCYSPSNLTENGENQSSATFVITVADGRSPCVSDYHRSVQKLALFFIENADNVDVANDSDGGFWKIMYIFQKHCDDNEKAGFKYSLVGYYTLFHFIALFHKPEPGVIVRVCQALILPPFQGQGHGGRLLQAVYKLAQRGTQQRRAEDRDEMYHNIIQINVEDPAPSFVALRNKIDFKFVLEHYDQWNWPNKGSLWSSQVNKSLASHDKLALFFSAMTEKEAAEMSIKAKITPKQLHIANELLKLKTLRENAEQPEGSFSSADKVTVDRFFRLMVKRRLNKEHQDELLEQPTKDDQKALLAKLFDIELKGYEKFLAKLSA